MTYVPPSTGNDEEDAILQEGIERFVSAQLAYASGREAAREDLQFVAGSQYTAVAPGDDDYRLQVNLLGPFLRQITAEARQMNPSITVVPVASESDVDKAEVIQGLIRTIEQKSNAEHVYQQALWYAAAGGEGYILVDTDYVSFDSDEQEYKIVLIDNPEKVFLDPLHTKLDGSDAEWGFIVEDLDHKTFLRKFPDAKLAEYIQSNSWNLLTLPNDWINKDTVRIAKYWYKSYEIVKTWRVKDPLTLKEYTVNEKPGNDVIQLTKNPKVQYKVTVNACQITCNQVLEQTTFPGPYIPIVKVTGECFWVGGQKAQFGAIRMAKDPQRQYNYAVSRQTEMIDQAPKNSFVITEKQMGNHSQKWANANRVNYGALPYNHEDGAAPPFRVQGLDVQAFSGVLQTRQAAFEDLKMTFGLQDASLGRPGNEVSGVAQQYRVDQSSRSTYQYFDHLLLAMKHIGRIIVGGIPVIYDTERLIRITKPSNETQLIYINSMRNNNKYDLTNGSYDITVDTGPAFASQREEAYEKLTEILTIQPTAPIGDLAVGLINTPMAKIAAARIKATIPPQIIAASGELDTKSDLSPEERAEKAQQQVAMLTNELQEANTSLKDVTEKLKVASDKAALELTKADMEHERETKKMENELEKAQADAAKEKEKLELDRAEAMAEYDLKREELRLKAKEVELAERQMALEEKRFEIEAAMAMHKVNEDTKPSKEDFGLGREDTNPNLPDIGDDFDI